MPLRIPQCAQAVGTCAQLTAQEPPDNHCSPVAFVKLKRSTLPRLFLQGGMANPPCDSTCVMAASDVAKTTTGFMQMSYCGITKVLSGCAPPLTQFPAPRRER